MMKRLTIVVSLIVLSTLACSLSGVGLEPTQPPTPTAEPPTQTVESSAPTEPLATPMPSASPTQAPLESEKRCPDGVCDGPENARNCPEDCQPVEGADTEVREAAAPTVEAMQEPSADTLQGSDQVILYHIVKHSVSSHQMNDATCHIFNFRRFLDGGYVQADGSQNQILELKDNPTSKVTARKLDTFFYISSPKDPVVEQFGVAMFNWDVEEQTLWSAESADNTPSEVAASRDIEFPGGVATSPENRYLLYLMTQRMSQDSTEPGGFMPNKFNPFVSDSSLLVARPNGEEKKSLPLDNYNRQLFTSFSDFSADGQYFYTIVRQGEGFGFVRVDLKSRQVEGFSQALPGFDWAKVPWDALFPRADDFSYASFRIAPDETRLIAYKNNFTANLENPCYSEASHDLWVFNIENDTMERFQDRPGYVTDADWKPDSMQLAMSTIGNSGCYPDYLDARIDTFDREGERVATLVQEPKSKTTTLGWSADGDSIAYDVYSTDFVGRLKLIDVVEGTVSEVLSTQTLGYEVDRAAPVTLLFADWVSQQ